MFSLRFIFVFPPVTLTSRVFSCFSLLYTTFFFFLLSIFICCICFLLLCSVFYWVSPSLCVKGFFYLSFPLFLLHFFHFISELPEARKALTILPTCSEATSPFFLTIQFTSNKLHTINNNKYWLPFATVASRIVCNRSAQFTPHIPHLERSVHYNRQAGDVARLGKRTSRDLQRSILLRSSHLFCLLVWVGV